MEQSVITRTITVAQGPFAPGHLGELTQQVPFELVDAILADTRAAQSRVRALPARVVVYLLLAGALFAEQGYQGVWQRLTAALEGLPVAQPTAAALTQARRRLGVAPLRALFDLLRGPAATPRFAGGVRWGGLLVCALDGTTMTVPDTPANLGIFPRSSSHAGYPLLRLVALVAVGTRTIIDAVLGPTSHGETTYAQRLTPSLTQRMLLLADRNFDAAKLFAAFAATGAAVLVRCKPARKLPILARYPDGSDLSLLGGCTIRVVAAEITIATRAGRRTGVYRLATTLTDHRAYPAFGLIRLYHQRWEIEMCQPQCTHKRGPAA